MSPRCLWITNESGALVTMAVVPQTEGAKYGGVRLDDDGVVTGFTKRGSTEPSYHFVGVQVVEARAFASIAPGVPAESVSEVYPALIAARRGSVRAYVCEARVLRHRHTRRLPAGVAHVRQREARRADAGLVRKDRPNGARRGFGPVGRCRSGSRLAAAAMRRHRRRARARRHLVDRRHADDAQMAICRPVESADRRPGRRVNLTSSVAKWLLIATQPDGADARVRINQFLAGSGRDGRRSFRSPATPPIVDTSASFSATRRRRCSPSIPGPIDFDALPFVNVARLLSAMPVPVPRILGRSPELGIIALEDLGDVTLQAHVGAASPAEHAALYREAVALINSIQQRGRELASPRLRAVRRLVRRREAHMGAAVLHEALPRGLPRRRALRCHARGADAGVRGDRRRTRSRTCACSATATITAGT